MFNWNFLESILVTKKLISKISELILMMITILMGEYI